MGYGRKKIEIRKIEEISSRNVTFTKRRQGLFKKARQLESMSGFKIAILVFSPAGNPFSYGDTESAMETLLNSYNHNDSNGSMSGCQTEIFAHDKATLLERPEETECCSRSDEINVPRLTLTGDSSEIRIGIGGDDFDDDDVCGSFQSASCVTKPFTTNSEANTSGKIEGPGPLRVDDYELNCSDPFMSYLIDEETNHEFEFMPARSSNQTELEFGDVHCSKLAVSTTDLASTSAKNEEFGALSTCCSGIVDPSYYELNYGLSYGLNYGDPLMDNCFSGERSQAFGCMTNNFVDNSFGFNGAIAAV
ncbi:OLC1v1005788C1 [Oldenlandia corymbosa var. corymbosa]|uniref:OLC1v1005788C1 n=1 Tax=Oldenlandia corymbosa var. corymbosa TaxID=529605 RepID=A0AAV1DHF9_OLDCO|nr:OLC1v1005788C1 [Oldenlandia corymbosa var. corymbosa]